MRIAGHISELIGNTPLVRLNSVVPEGAGIVAAKIEYLNPGGSAKDRIAVKMIDAAEASGELKPGGTIVEPTSGNTGVGLALVAQQRGYRCIFVCPDKVSEDKQNVLRAYGADVVVSPTAVPPDHPDSYYSVSNRLVEEIDGAWKQATSELAYERSGPERFLETYYVLTELVRAVGAKPDTRSAEGIGRLVAQLHTMRRMSVSVAGMLQAGKEPVVEASIVKDIGTVWEQQLPHRVRDLAAFVDPDASNHETLENQLSFAIKTAPKLTIQGGTTEVLRGIIARGLGLR